MFEFLKLEHDLLPIVLELLKLRHDSKLFCNNHVRVLKTGTRYATYRARVIETET